MKVTNEVVIVTGASGFDRAVIILSLLRGVRSREHYGSWDRFIV